jgi:MerR family regulatory protein
MTQLAVSDLARQADVAPHTVRYHDRVCSLPTPHRSPSGYRLYRRTSSSGCASSAAPNAPDCVTVRT